MSERMTKTLAVTQPDINGIVRTERYNVPESVAVATATVRVLIRNRQDERKFRGICSHRGITIRQQIDVTGDVHTFRVYGTQADLNALGTCPLLLNSKQMSAYGGSTSYGGKIDTREIRVARNGSGSADAQAALRAKKIRPEVHDCRMRAKRIEAAAIGHKQDTKQTAIDCQTFEHCAEVYRIPHAEPHKPIPSVLPIPGEPQADSDGIREPADTAPISEPEASAAKAIAERKPTVVQQWLAKRELQRKLRER